jgi:hypothetical protein
MKDPHKRRRTRRASKQPKAIEAAFSNWQPFPHSWTPQEAERDRQRIIELYPELVKDATATLETVGPIFTGIEAARNPVLETEMPWAPQNPEERMYLLFTFSTCPQPKGLGLSKDQFWRMGYREWLAHYRGWKGSRRLPPGGDGIGSIRPRGAPKKPIAEMTRARWEEIGRPELTGKVCDELAKFSYRGEYGRTRPGSKGRKRLRDRVGRQVRALMKKSPTAPAT